MSAIKNCCEDSVVVTPNLSVRLLNGVLYITYDGKVQTVPLTGLGSGSGDVLPPLISEVEITTDGQTYFSGVIPSDRQVIKIYVNGKPHFEGQSYVVTSNNITWTGSYPLQTTNTLMIETWPL